MLILLYFLIQENHSLLQKFQHRYDNMSTKLQQLNSIVYTKLTATSPTTATTTNYTNCIKLNFPNYTKLHLNLSTMATLGTAESGHHKEVAIVEKFKPELIYYGLFASQDKKSGHCGEKDKVEAPLYAKLQQLQLQHQSQATMLTYCSTLKWQDINIIIDLFRDGNLRSITKFPYE